MALVRVGGAGFSAAALILLASCLVGAQFSASVLELKAVANRSISVRIQAPSAKEVKVFVDTMPVSAALPLSKGADGVWSGVIGPLEPDVYMASCVIDGQQMVAGFAHVIGPAPEAWD